MRINFTHDNNKKLNDTGYNLKFTKFEKACNDYLDYLYYKISKLILKKILLFGFTAFRKNSI